MQQEQLLLAQAIDYNPLVISADLPLAEAIALMSQTWSNCCDRLEGQNSVQASHPHSNQPHHGRDNHGRGSPAIAGLKVRSADCMVVVEDNQVKGIFTEQDLIRLLSSGKSFHGLSLGTVIKTPIVCLQTAIDQSIFSALRLFEQHDIQHLPVIDEQQQLVGLITPQSIENALEPSDLQQGCRVENVMTTQITRVPSSASVLKVAQKMSDAQTSCVILTQPLEEAEGMENKDAESLPQRPIGIITEQDILQLYHLGLDLAQVSVRTVMSMPIFSVAPDDSVWFARQRMKHYRIRHLAVIRSDGSLQGLMTQTHLIQAIEPLEMRQVFRALRAQHREELPVYFLQSRTSALVQDVQSYAEILKSQQEQAELFAAIAERIQKFLSLPDILNNAVTDVRDFLRADRVLIYQFATDMSGTIMAESVGEQWPHALHSHIEDRCFQARGHKAYGQGRRRAIDDIYSADLSRCHIELLERFKVRANLVVPIAIGDHLWGLLIAHQCSRPRHWEGHEFEVLERLSVQIAIAIRQAEISLEKKQLEEQFLRIQRLESVGTLASGIAHDLNNILTPIIGIAQLLPIKLANIDPSTQQLIDILYQSAKRGSDIVNQILLFARGAVSYSSSIYSKKFMS
jgi:CBS domain-containing protein